MYNIEEMKIGGFEVKKVPMNVFEVFTGFHVTTACSGKMEGLWAFNTSCLANPFCQAMQNNEEFVCSKCYAKQYLGYRKSCDTKFTENFHAIQKRWEYVPDLEAAMFNKVLKVVRLDEFGELGSVQHAINYLLVVIANPTVMFGLWTKRPNLFEVAMAVMGLGNVPDNLSMVGSSFKLNEESDIFDRNYSGTFDHVFTVYSGKYAIDNSVDCNCAGESCIKCMKCYRKGGQRYIREMVKNDHNTILRRLKNGTVVKNDDGTYAVIIKHK